VGQDFNLEPSNQETEMTIILPRLWVNFSIKTNCYSHRKHKTPVSRWLPTAAARVRARVWQVGFVVDKVVLGQVFSEYFGFPCQSSFYQILCHHNHPEKVQ
jgi:hypothetical protein